MAVCPQAENMTAYSVSALACFFFFKKIVITCIISNYKDAFLPVCVKVDSEEPVFEAVLNWVKHNRKEREPYLPDMLEFVRMPLLTPRYITDVIDAEVNAATRRSPWPPLLLLKAFFLTFEAPH